MPSRPIVQIYTDGACRGNPGAGGWGAVLQSGDRRKEIRGAEDPTTNNRMELTAAIMALQALRNRSTVELFTDSQYVRQGITQWLLNWKRNGWRTASKKPVKNLDLWQRLDELAGRHQVEWIWIKGHSGHPGNERADLLANMAIDDLVKDSA